MVHTRVGRFLCETHWFFPTTIRFFIPPPQDAQTSPHITTYDVEVSSTPHTIRGEFARRRASEVGHTKNRSGGKSREFLYVFWRSWRSFRLPTPRRAYAPPLRPTSIPLNVPLTEPPLTSQITVPCARSNVVAVPFGQVPESRGRVVSSSGVGSVGRRERERRPKSGGGRLLC